MSATVAKIARRQVRRVLGEDVYRVLQAIDLKQQGLAQLGQRLEGGQTALSDRLSDVERWKARSFTGRLKWLLRGC